MKNNVFLFVFFCLGMLFGAIFTYFASNFATEYVYGSDVNIVKNHTNEQLIKYIEGKWTSAAGEVTININPKENIGSMKIFEKKTELVKEFNILHIDYLDGFFGYTKLIICKHNECKDQYTVQINKIFGINNVIVITYPPEISECIVIDGMCSRTFKQIKSK